MPKRSFKNFVEQELGKIPQFVIYAFLEWILIAILFVDGIIAFLSNEFARFFDLQIPCLLCTRIDHVLVRRTPDFYYNSSICDSHKKNVSSLAYCHVHKKISEIKHMCEGCLLSFATEKESDCDTYKSLIGILHKDLELLIDDEKDLQLSFPASGPKKDENIVQQNVDYRTKYDNSGNMFQSQQRCSCCSEFLKVRSEKPKGSSSLAPTPSPRVSFNRNSSQIKSKEINKSSNNESELTSDYEDSSNTISNDEQVEEQTPSFVRGGNKFFGIPLSDSVQNSPRWSVRSFKKPFSEKNDISTDQTDANEGDSILNHLKRQVRLDRKSLMALYMELDEERSASNVAANNAMAMITRLQDEKAALQMDALQYQRMMEEQVEYDQEALQSMNNMLAKREDEIKELEAELEAYREKYGNLAEEDGEEELVAQGRVIKIEGNDVAEISTVCCSSKGSNDEETSCLGKLEQSDGSIHESSTGNIVASNDEKGNGKKEELAKELSEITEKLNALETSGDLLKHLSEGLDASEGEAILLQISQNLQMLRSFVAMPADA